MPVAVFGWNIILLCSLSYALAARMKDIYSEFLIFYFKFAWEILEMLKRFLSKNLKGRGRLGDRSGGGRTTITVDTNKI